MLDHPGMFLDRELPARRGRGRPRKVQPAPATLSSDAAPSALPGIDDGIFDPPSASEPKEPGLHELFGRWIDVRLAIARQKNEQVAAEALPPLMYPRTLPRGFVQVDVSATEPINLLHIIFCGLHDGQVPPLTSDFRKWALSDEADAILHRVCRDRENWVHISCLVYTDILHRRSLMAKPGSAA